jgi:hypothetical protein
VYTTIRIGLVATVVAVAAGCGGQAQPVGIGRLHALFARAAQNKRTVTAVMTEQDRPSAVVATLTCAIRMTPDRASDCTVPVSGADGPMRVVTLPDAVYIYSSDPMLRVDGKPWRRLDPDGGDFLAAMSGEQALAATDNPVLDPHVSTVASSAPDSADGVAATRYDLRVDAPALFSRLERATEDSAARDTLRRMAATGVASAQVWIGPGELPVRIVTRVGARATRPRTETVAYLDWGEPVDISAPPADQVAAGH